MSSIQKVGQNLGKGGSHSNIMTLHVRGPNHQILISQIDHQRMAWISADDKANINCSARKYIFSFGKCSLRFVSNHLIE